jgi:UDP-GlcNAc:undecaprenyl-phosphate/decaprenyl-phosphate GlcNAc-1-phosphate transferase
VRFVPAAGDVLPILVLAFVAAAAVSYFLTPVIRRVAIRLRMVDRPDARRVNIRPVPRGGGIAVAIAFVGVSLVLLAINAQLNLVHTPPLLESAQLVALLAGGATAAALGALDDYFDLRARYQLLTQLGLAIAAVALGISVDFIANPFGPNNIVLSEPFAAAFTVVWIVGMINSVNFIDGLDGLSSGIALIAAITLAIISLTTQIGPLGQPFVSLLCVVLAGALLGFLRWNTHPASIFTGTSGTMVVGYSLALLSILGSAKVAVALLVLGVPIIDTFWIIVRRLVGGRSPFSPDRGHIHHRLLGLGLSHRQAVVLIYALCAGLGLLSLVLSGAGQLYAFLGVFVGTGLVLLFLAWGGFEDTALEADSYVNGDGPKAD